MLRNTWPLSYMGNRRGGGSGATGAPQFVASNSAGGGTLPDTISVDYPEGLQANDVAIMLVSSVNAAGAHTYDPPDGYTQLTGHTLNTTTRRIVYWKRLDGTETGSVVINPSGGPSGGYVAYLLIYRGCKQSGDPVEQAGTLSRFSVTEISQLGVPIRNIASPDRTLLHFYTAFDSGALPSITQQSDFTQRAHGSYGNTRVSISEKQLTTPGYFGEICDTSITIDGFWGGIYLSLVPETEISSSTPAPTDPHIANVKALLSFGELDAAVNFVDEVLPSRVSSGIGSPETDTAQAKFGAASLRAPASGLVTFPSNADWQFGADQFTLDLWARWNAVNNTGFEYFLANYDIGTNQRSWALLRQAGSLQMLVSSAGTSGTAVASAAWVPSTATWYLVSADFDGTNYRTYVDGVMIGKSGSPITLHNSTAALSIGAALQNGANNGVLDGWIDEVRITKGVARYASDAGFTPPSAAFPRS